MSAATLAPTVRRSPVVPVTPPVSPSASSAAPWEIVTETGKLVFPTDAATLPGFRRWTASPNFPETGRIDFVDGTLYFDLMPERANSHGLPKTELVRVVANRAVASKLGSVFTDSMRVVIAGPPATSCEPDLIFVSYDSLLSGRVRRVPTADGNDTIEFEGPVDLVCELLSPSSEGKDTVRLPAAFFAGGVREYWLVDCRDGAATLTVHGRGAAGFEPVAADADGFQSSPVLGMTYRLVRTVDPLGDPAFTLEER